MKDLKPCPFCGGEIVSDSYQQGTEDREGIPMNIYCPDCGAYGPWKYVSDNRPDNEVFELWNKRAGDKKEYVDRNCRNCTHWKYDDTNGNKFLLKNDQVGVCKEIQFSDHIDIELVTGWGGGSVDKIETTSIFFCFHFKELAMDKKECTEDS